MDYSSTTDYSNALASSGSSAVSSGVGLAILGVYTVVWLVILVVGIVAMWKIFKKANQPGWAALVPIYNMYIMLKIVGRPGWWLLLLIIPLVNIVISLILAIDLAKSFGKDAAYGVILLWLLSFIGYLILAFGKDQYVGPAALKSATPQTPSAPEIPVAPLEAQPSV